MSPEAGQAHKTVSEVSSEVFILGAGFSKAISNEMPLLDELYPLVKRHLDLLPIEDEKSSSLERNFELLLTFLSEDHPYLTPSQNGRQLAAYREVVKELATDLRERSRRARQGNPPEWLSQLVHYWRRNKSTIISFNYDDLVERMNQERNTSDGNDSMASSYSLNIAPVLVRRGVSLNTFLSAEPPPFSLLKLHGSVNWFFEETGAGAEPVYYVPVIGRWRPTEVEIPKEQLHWEAAETMDRFIVPPQIAKSRRYQHRLLRDLWSTAAESLKRARRIYCLGYSLPSSDTAMMYFLHVNRPSGTSVDWVLGNSNRDVNSHFRSVLPKWFKVVDTYVGDKSIENLVAGEGLT